MPVDASPSVCGGQDVPHRMRCRVGMRNYHDWRPKTTCDSMDGTQSHSFRHAQLPSMHSQG